MTELLILLIKIFVVFNIIMGLASLCTWVERKGSALIQDRIGANRAGAYFESSNWLLNNTIFVAIRWAGILGIINTLLCDAVKAVFKEDFVPEGTSLFMHNLGPFLAVFPIFVAFALVPIAPDFDLFGYHIRAQVASLDAGILFILAMGSVSVYGVAFAGWTGNNKFSLLGGLRAAAQMISYELAMGIALATVIMTYGTLDLYEMVEAQSGLHWGIILQPVSFLILFVVGMAETKRGPFDLPESESELVAGYFTEYSGMKFLLFWLGEFAEIALFALLLTLLFFGGWKGGITLTNYGIDALNYLLSVASTWQIPQIPPNHWVGALVGHGMLMLKVVFFCVLQIVIRWTLPRFRYDQLMNLGWKVLLPLSLVNLMVTAAVIIAR